MRKTLIALILVLPMVFVLVIFSSVNLVSLGVNISVNGITLLSEDAKDGTIFMDMAESPEMYLKAEVSPGNATNKEYTLTPSDPSVVDLVRVKDESAEEGNAYKYRIVPKAEGNITVTATSKDKGFTDSVAVSVVSSKPYDFSFSLSDEDGADLIEAREGGYAADGIPAGTYHYDVSILPAGYTEYSYNIVNANYAEIEPGKKTLFLPFSGSTVFTVSVPGGVNGTITKTVTCNVAKPQAGEAVVNGSKEHTVQLVEGTKETKLYLEGSGSFTAAGFDAGSFASLDPADPFTRLGDGKYILNIKIAGEANDSFPATIQIGSTKVDLLFSFAPFEFSVFSDMPISEEAGRREAALITGNAVSFYAVATDGAKDVEYRWEIESFNGEKTDGVLTAEGASAKVKAAQEGSYVLRATAIYQEERKTQEIFLTVFNKVSAIQIVNNVKVDLAQYYTVAGLKYGEGGATVSNTYPLNVYVFGTFAEDGSYTAADAKEIKGIACSVDNEKVAKVDESFTLIPLGTGTVTVTFYWLGNEAFHTKVATTLTLNVVHDAVAVKNAPELVKATEEGKKVVLTENIKLGTDEKGNVFSADVRDSLLLSHRMRSTYNTEWYAATSDPNAAEPYVSYVMEFKNDVYGNGKYIDADNYTHALDSTGSPLLKHYRGPLYFVNYRSMASVAGQDNIAFLIRTKNVTLYGVNLLGCSDGSLKGEDGGYDLSNLNLTGTTLEINADAQIVNCRVRNGRNVVRAYGGNTGGTRYFIDSLAENGGCDGERINVGIRGCILSQGREFILKIGANRALRASLSGGAEPVLTDQNGKAYPEIKKNGSSASNNYTAQDGGALFNDPWFYRQYVMTDVTLEDSVLETSGLFTVGVESNFAGSFLYGGAGDHTWRNFTKEWERSGGTSFASVLRLKGDVRLYDWKDLSLVDASTLIESPTGALQQWLKLDIKSMLNFVMRDHADDYGNVIETVGEGENARQFVHGGIALYGGGRNYSSVDLSELKASLSDFLYVNVNISILKNGTDDSMRRQGELLPSAAGTRDFNFYMYGSGTANDYTKQLNDEQMGLKYKGVSPFPLF